jgi:hypothetical protein
VGEAVAEGRYSVSSQRRFFLPVRTAISHALIGYEPSFARNLGTRRNLRCEETLYAWCK